MNTVRSPQHGFNIFQHIKTPKYCTILYQKERKEEKKTKPKDVPPYCTVLYTKYNFTRFNIYTVYILV